MQPHHRIHFSSSLLLALQLSSDVARAQLPLVVRSPSGGVEERLPEMLSRVRTKYGGGASGRGSADRQGNGWVSLETGQAVKLGTRKRKRGSGRKRQTGTGRSETASIINYEDDTSYYAPLGIGTPPKYYNVLLDTGSSDLWVASKSCVSGCPTGVPTFDPKGSSTFLYPNRTFSIRYGSGNVAGVLGTDTVTFPAASAAEPSQFIVPNQTFGVVDHVSSSLLQPPVSGLLGLGFQTIANSGATPPWEALVKQGAWKEPQMGFYFTRYGNLTSLEGQASQTVPSPPHPGGQFTMGGTNSTLYRGDIDYVNIPQGQESYWLIPLSSISVNGVKIDVSSGSPVVSSGLPTATGIPTIPTNSPTGASSGVGGQLAAIDTGTSLIGGPSTVISKIYASIPGSLRGTGDSAGYYAIPCSTSVPVSLSFTSRSWSISTADLQFGLIGETSEQYCLGAFFDISLGVGSVQWVVGQAFLKNVYSVYRYSPASVGFAELSGVDGALPFPETSGLLTDTSGSVQGSQSPRVVTVTSTSTTGGFNPIPTSGAQARFTNEWPLIVMFGSLLSLLFL